MSKLLPMSICSFWLFASQFCRLNNLFDGSPCSQNRNWVSLRNSCYLLEKWLCFGSRYRLCCESDRYRSSITHLWAVSNFEPFDLRDIPPTLPEPKRQRIFVHHVSNFCRKSMCRCCRVWLEFQNVRLFQLMLSFQWPPVLLDTNVFGFWFFIRLLFFQWLSKQKTFRNAFTGYILEVVLSATLSPLTPMFSMSSSFF